MIVDGHAYLFPPADSPAGYDTLDEKMAHWQRELGGHHQPVWRVRDRSVADNGTLVDPETFELRPVKWKRHLGQSAWEYQGETYTKQYVPPMLHNLEATPEMLISEMDYAGVDVAVLHHSPHLGLLNEFLTDAVRRFPARLARLINARDGDTPLAVEASIAEVRRHVGAAGPTGLQFSSKSYYLGGHSEPWDDGAMRPFWEAVATMNIPVYFTLAGPRPVERYSSAEQEGYLAEHKALLRWMERYPQVTVVITHGLSWRSFIQGDGITLPEQIWDVFKSPRCHLQLLFPIQLGGLWEYPWREAEPTVRECVQRIGADRLIWGTDMPMVARFCTYRQALDQYRVHCDFLSDAERAAIIGGTAARVMGVRGSGNQG